MSRSSAIPERVLVVGEALIDVVIDGSSVQRTPGGSPLNVACGLGLLQVPTTLATAFGDDADGLAIGRHLAKAGVDVLHGNSSSPAMITGTATATIDEDGFAGYSFSVDWSPRFDITDKPRLVHAGSIAAFRSPGCSEVRSLVEAASSASTIVTFDPNIREELIPSRERVLDDCAWFAERASVVKLSDDDAQWLFPGMSQRDVLRWFRSRGVELAIMTLGADGCILQTRERELVTPGRKVEVVDTIGAGDSFMAAVIAMLVEESAVRPPSGLTSDELEQLGRFAVAASSLTVRKRGASLPSRAQVASTL